jgi:hypothetical protein
MTSSARVGNPARRQLVTVRLWDTLSRFRESVRRGRSDNLASYNVMH